MLKLAAERPELAGPIVAGQPDLLAEAVIAARLEQARSVADVLLRRTRLGLLAAPSFATPNPCGRRRGARRRAGLERRPGRAEAEAWVGVAKARGSIRETP